MSRKEPEAPAVVGKAYDFVLWLLPKVENFERNHRFTVGERLSASGLDLLNILVEAAYVRDKADLLQQANRKINSTRYSCGSASEAGPGHRQLPDPTNSESNSAMSAGEPSAPPSPWAELPAAIVTLPH